MFAYKIITKLKTELFFRLSNEVKQRTIKMKKLDFFSKNTTNVLLSQ